MSLRRQLAARIAARRDVLAHFVGQLLVEHQLEAVHLAPQVDLRRQHQVALGDAGGRLGLGAEPGRRSGKTRNESLDRAITRP